MIEALIATSALWALVIGWAAARGVWFLLSRREYRGRPGRNRTNWGHARCGVSAAPSRPGPQKAIKRDAIYRVR